MLQAQYYNRKLNVNLMLDTNDITTSTPENHYKSSPESQLTITYSISKNVEVSVGMRCSRINKYGTLCRRSSFKRSTTTILARDIIW